jgi:hypothetical protein
VLNWVTELRWIESDAETRAMELRDITNEIALLKSYKTVYVDNQKYELLKIYRDRGRKFPIFTERVFAASAKTPVGYINYKIRESMDDADAGRIFILERIDNRSDATLTRLFFTWVSPKLAAQFSSSAPDSIHVKANVIFHPVPRGYPGYWAGDIDTPNKKNYLQLGVRYLFQEKYSVTQHFCAIRPSSTLGPTNGPDDKKSPFAGMVVVPVSSQSSFDNLANPKALQEALEQVARRCYEGVTSKLAAPNAVTLDRIAVSGYSRSGTILSHLLNNARANEPFMRSTLKEVYAFDVMLDERDKGNKVVKTKQQGYEEFWTRLKTWQGDESDKKIRLYSAEPDTVRSVYAELQDQLKRYGGGYHNKAVGFTAFNKTPKPDSSGVYSGLIDGYELYSTDNSRSLVLLPSINAHIYLLEDNLVNAGGFRFGGDYEPDLHGHSWFISRLQTHALFHSGF